MKNFFNKWKSAKKTVNQKLLVVFLIMLVLAGSFLGFEYVPAVLFIAGLFYMARQAEGEKTTPPWEIDERKREIEALEKKAEIIRLHIEKREEDLDAKLRLNELEEQIEAAKRKLREE